MFLILILNWVPQAQPGAITEPRVRIKPEHQMWPKPHHPKSHNLVWPRCWPQSEAEPAVNPGCGNTVEGALEVLGRKGLQETEEREDPGREEALGPLCYWTAFRLKLIQAVPACTRSSPGHRLASAAASSAGSDPLHIPGVFAQLSPQPFLSAP